MLKMGEMKRAQELRVDEVSVQKIERKSRDNSAAHFPIAASARTWWILWMILENFKMWNRIIVEGCLTLPVNLWWFRVHVPCSTATKIAAWHMQSIWLQENVFGTQFSTFDSDSPRDHPQRIQSDDAQRNREPVPEARRTKTTHTSEDRQNHGTIPMPTFATKTVDYEFYNTGGITAELHGRTAETAIRQIPQSTMQKETVPRNSWPILSRSWISYSNDWTSSRRRTLWTMGCSCGWGSHSPFDNTRILPLQEQMVASFQQARY